MKAFLTTYKSNEVHYIYMEGGGREHSQKEIISTQKARILKIWNHISKVEWLKDTEYPLSY